MPEVLNQKEVDALLAAVERGQVSMAESAQGPNVSLYDFRRPERVSKDHLRALDALHEGFARTFGASLSAVMRTIIEVRVHSVEQCTYGEFILSLPNPTCFYLLGVKPMDGNLILELNPSIVYPMLDRLLGGGREAPVIPDRPVTEIEQRLVDRIVDRALRALAETWSPIQTIEVSVLQKESNPQLIQVLPGGEVVVLVTVELKVGEASGMMNLCLPFGVIEPMMARLSTAGGLDYAPHESAPVNAEAIAGTLNRAPVEVAATLAETTITVGDLMGIAVGDVLRTDKPSDSTVLVTVEGRPKFRARPAQHRGKKAVIIEKPAGPHDRA